MTNTVNSDPEQRSLSYGRTLWRQFLQDSRNADDSERQALMSRYQAELEGSASRGYMTEFVHQGFSQEEMKHYSMRERLS